MKMYTERAVNSYKAKTVNKYNKDIREREKLIAERNKALNNLGKICKEKDEIIKEKEKEISKLNNVVNGGSENDIIIADLQATEMEVLKKFGTQDEMDYINSLLSNL